MSAELLFLIEDAAEGGYTARAVRADIFTEVDTLGALRLNIREAVECHFEDARAPQLRGLPVSAPGGGGGT